MDELNLLRVVHVESSSHVYLNSVQQMVSGEYGRGVSPDTDC